MGINSTPWTIGIEEEYFLIDADTKEIVNRIPDELIQDCESACPNQIVTEFLNSQIELVSKPCASIVELKIEVLRLRTALADVSLQYDLLPLASSTHPTALWEEQTSNSAQRYQYLAGELQLAAKRMLVGGMHIHVGVPDPEQRFSLWQQLIWYLPHLMALSTSSPFWRGLDTGTNSFRVNVVNGLPRSGIPPCLTTLDEYSLYIDTLEQTGVIKTASEFWWDARMSCRFPTLEMRVTDICPRLDDAISIAAFYLCLIVHLAEQSDTDPQLTRLQQQFNQENYWRAQRFSLLDGDFLTKQGEKISLQEEFQQLLQQLIPQAEQLNCLTELDHIKQIVSNGTSADRQRNAYQDALAQGLNASQAFTNAIDCILADSGMNNPYPNQLIQSKTAAG